MTFNEYQKFAQTTAIYKDVDNFLPIYPSLKLAGEAGEVAEKVGKAIRDGVGDDPAKFRMELAKELGDVVADISSRIGYTLEDIAIMNRLKLESRKSRGVLGGSGDNR